MEILDAGYINLIDHMGNDLSIVNAARKSYSKKSKEFDEKDKQLLRYLWENNHLGPFEFVEFVFEVKAPLFVVRQWQRHRSLSFAETSKRFTSKNLEFHFPESWRKQDEVNKQGSYEDNYNGKIWHNILNSSLQHCLTAYHTMINNGICREQARMVLPQNMYVEMFVKGNLRNFLHFLDLRLDEHAQKEIRDYAYGMISLIEPIVPETMKLFREKYLL